MNCHCKKKLARLLFDFGVIPQVVSMQLTVIARFCLFHSANNSSQHLWYEDGRALLRTTVVRHVNSKAVINI